MKYLDKIAHAGLRIMKIVKGLRHVARQDGNEPFRPEKISTIINSTLDLFNAQFKNKCIEVAVTGLVVAKPTRKYLQKA